MPPEETVWTLKPHSMGKHQVLRHYLDAWLPIVGSTHDVITVVDGFAGAGGYDEGEVGSPVLAMKALAEHTHQRNIKATVQFEFIEADEARRRELNRNIRDNEHLLPTDCQTTIHPGTFDDVASQVLDEVDRGERQLGPAFFLIDPFGAKGVRYETIAKIMQLPSCEVLLTFMYSSFNQWKSQDSMARNLDKLFGSPDWRELGDNQDPTERKYATYDLFKRELKEAGAKYVLTFEVYRRENDLVYALFFATQSRKGCEVMKEAMWKVDPSGGYRFQGGRLGQTRLEISVDTSNLRSELVERFGRGVWVPIEELEQFMQSDETLFHSGHLKTKTLAPMKREGLILVERPPGQGGFKPGTKIKFLDDPVDTPPSAVQIDLLS